MSQAPSPELWIGSISVGFLVLGLSYAAALFAQARGQPLSLREIFGIVFIEEHSQWQIGLSLLPLAFAQLNQDLPRLCKLVSSVPSDICSAVQLASGDDLWVTLSVVIIFALVMLLGRQLERIQQLRRIGSAPRRFRRLVLAYICPLIAVVCLQGINLFLGFQSLAALGVIFFAYAACGQFHVFVEMFGEGPGRE